jgi:hypothetical protein
MAGDTAETSVVRSQEGFLDENLLPCLQRRQFSASPLPLGELLFLLGLFGQALDRFLIGVALDAVRVIGGRVFAILLGRRQREASGQISCYFVPVLRAALSVDPSDRCGWRRTWRYLGAGATAG